MSSINASQVLETKPVGKLLLQYSIPAIIGMTVTSLYNIIDSVFIGHGVGPLAISGLAITFPLMNLIIAFSTLVGIGGATISSIYLGQKDTEKTNSVLGNVLLLCMINGFCFGGLTLIFLDPILHFFGASPATLPYARDFMQVILAHRSENNNSPVLVTQTIGQMLVDGGVRIGPEMKLQHGQPNEIVSMQSVQKI